MDNKKYVQPIIKSGSYCNNSKNETRSDKQGENRNVSATDYKVFSEISYPTKVVRSEIIGYVKK